MVVTSSVSATSEAPSAKEGCLHSGNFRHSKSGEFRV